MARIVKAADVRRAEILDTAQKLFYTQGYENTSIQSIIDEIGIAKGTFYHHYDSKQALLDALVMHILEQMLQTLEPMVNDSQLNALEKLQRFFIEANNLGFENRELSLTLMQVWYKDENAILRYKMQVKATEQFGPLLTQIIRQGVMEGCFSTDYPKYTAEVIFDITQGLDEPVTKLLLRADSDPVVWTTIDQKIAACEQAITRVLDAPNGSIRITNITDLRELVGS